MLPVKNILKAVCSSNYIVSENKIVIRQWKYLKFLLRQLEK